MDRKQRGSKPAPGHGPCAVCGARDARGLLMVELPSGTRVTLCGSHELMFRRGGSRARTVAELRTSYGERRETDRRAVGEVDELAAKLAAAFTRERRDRERRAS